MNDLEILSLEEFERLKSVGYHNQALLTIEAMAEALAIVDEDDGFQLAKTSIEAMEPLREKGWLA